MLALFVAGLLAFGPLGAGESVVVFPEMGGSLPKPVRDTLVRAAGDVLVEHGLQATRPDAGCTSYADPGCRETLLAGRLGLSIEVELQASDYAVTARVVATDGSVVQTSTEVCKICRHDELPATVRKAVEDVMTTLEDAQPKTGTLSIVSTPSGASVSVDGANAGETPLDLELAAGSHAIGVSAPGRVGATEQTDIAAGEVTRRAYELRPDGLVSPRTEIGLGWGVVAVGAVVAFSGISLLVLDEQQIASQCEGNDVDADGDCRYLYDTVLTGAGLLAGGVAVAGGGGLMVWHGKRRSARRPASVALNSMGLQVSF